MVQLYTANVLLQPDKIIEFLSGRNDAVRPKGISMGVDPKRGNIKPLNGDSALYSTVEPFKHKTLDYNLRSLLMNINCFVEECFTIATKKGFYPKESKIEMHITGLISELYECYEAHRNKLFTDRFTYDSQWFKNPNSKAQPWRILFSKNVKNTFEDEVADLFIRVLNLSAFLNIKLETDYLKTSYLEGLSLDNQILYLNNFILKYNDLGVKLWINMLLRNLVEICEIYNIPIKQHIIAKIEYNKTRDYLHGKEY